MKLWFENTNRDENDPLRRRVICDCMTWKEVDRSIDEFIQQCNETKPKKNSFKRYYTRVWPSEGMTKIDVGSHTEFFYWEGDYPENKGSGKNDNS